MEAIYLITPCEKSIHALINDFVSVNRAMYKGAHVYFTEGMSDFQLVRVRQESPQEAHQLTEHGGAWQTRAEHEGSDQPRASRKLF